MRKRTGDAYVALVKVEWNRVYCTSSKEEVLFSRKQSVDGEATKLGQARSTAYA